MSLQNITFLGLASKTDALKNAYDEVATHDNEDEVMEFEFNESLKNAD